MILVVVVFAFAAVLTTHPVATTAPTWPTMNAATVHVTELTHSAPLSRWMNNSPVALPMTKSATASLLRSVIRSSPSIQKRPVASYGRASPIYAGGCNLAAAFARFTAACVYFNASSALTSAVIFFTNTSIAVSIVSIGFYLRRLAAKNH